MPKININDLPRPLQWIVILLFIGLLIFVMEEFTEEVKEISGEDSYAHNASKSGLEGLENLEDGVKVARKVDGVASKLPKK